MSAFALWASKGERERHRRQRHRSRCVIAVNKISFGEARDASIFGVCSCPRHCSSEHHPKKRGAGNRHREVAMGRGSATTESVPCAMCAKKFVGVPRRRVLPLCSDIHANRVLSNMQVCESREKEESGRENAR